MNKVLLITLFALATTVYSACDHWDRHAIYLGGECVEFGGCDYDVLWWIQYNSPFTHPDRFTKHDTNCVDGYELPAFNCYPHQTSCMAGDCCESGEVCCGGIWDEPRCCQAGQYCVQLENANHEFYNDCADEDNDRCEYGWDGDTCYAISAVASDTWCQSSCVDGARQLAVACDANYPSTQICQCGCEPLPVDECTGYIPNGDACYSNGDPRADDEWCRLNCVDAADGIHPACDFRTGDVHVTCRCDCDGTIVPDEEEGGQEEEEEQVVTDEGSITIQLPKPDCDYVTFWSECDYKGTEMVIEDDVDCLDWLPGSFCVPSGLEVTLFDVCQYNGQSAIFTESVECMDQLTIVSLLEQKVKLTGQKKLLKVNKSKEEKQKFQIRKL